MFAWSKKLNIGFNTIKQRLEQEGVKSIEGKSSNGIICDFYSEPDVYRICADFLRPMPQCDESNFFEKDGIIYGTLTGLVKALGISRKIIVRRLELSDIQSIKGKTLLNRIRDFYPEPAVHEACADLIEKRKKANPKRS